MDSRRIEELPRDFKRYVRRGRRWAEGAGGRREERKEEDKKEREEERKEARREWNRKVKEWKEKVNVEE